MMFTPTSGRKAVRQRNASVITELSSLYASLMSNWISQQSDNVATSAHAGVEEKGNDLEGDSSVKVPISPVWVTGFRERLIGLAAQIQALRLQTAVAKWEGNIRGVWPIEEYMNLVNTESDMLAAIAQV